MFHTWPDVLLAVLAFLTLLANQWIANKRQAKDIKDHGDLGRKELSTVVEGKVEEAKSKVQETKEVNVQALHEANTFNNKLLAVIERVDAMDKRLDLIDRNGTAGIRLVNDRLERIEALLQPKPLQ